MASPRPFVLAVIGGAGTRQIEAPTIREAIIEAESQGGRVHAGRALDGGVPRFDDEAELEEFMRTHRSPAGGAR